MKKKIIISLLTLVCLVVGMNMISCQAETYAGSCGTNVTYTLDTETGVLTISGTGAMKSYLSSSDVPWYYKRSYINSVVIETGVTKIGNNAFYNCDKLANINIPNSVTSIGEYTFYACRGLTSVMIPNSVMSIGDSAFCDCTSLSGTLILDKVESIGSHAFRNCSGLTSITIGSGAKSIGSGAFGGCSGLTSVELSDSVTSIGTAVLLGCNNIEELTIPFIGNKRDAGGSKEGVFGYLFGRSSSTSISEATEQQYGAYLMCYYDIPESLKKVTITNETAIPYGAFYNCSNIEKIILNEGIKSIAYYAFYNCSGLKEAIYPGNKDALSISSYNSDLISVIKYAKGSCGESCSWVLDYDTGVLTISGSGAMNFYSEFAPWYNSRGNIREVIIEEGITTIDEHAFSYCSGLTNVTIPDSVTSVGSYAFYDCNKLEDINIPDGMTSIGDYVFYNCDSLTNITIPDGVTSIGSYAFYDCNKLGDINIPDGVTSIGSYAFYDCNKLKDINIPDGVTNIGDYMFYSCDELANINIPDSVTSIGEYTFYACRGLTSVMIPNSVMSIGDSAFGACSNLQEITLPFVGCKRGITGTVSSVLGYIFGGSSSSYYGYTVQYYRDPSSNYVYCYNYYNIPSSLKKVTITDETVIPYGAFYNCSNITEIVINEGVTSIENCAFYNCSGLMDAVYLGNKDALEIGYNNNSDLTSVIRYVKGSCGESCTWTLDYETGVLSIVGTGKMTDWSYSSNVPWHTNRGYIKSIMIGDGITTIGNYAFYNCEEMADVTIPNSVTRIGNSVFSDCSSLISVTIPDGVTSIGNYAFSGCSGLTNIILPDSVTSIGNYAFSGCSSLISVVLPDSVMNINNGIFKDCSSLTSVAIPDSVTSIGDYALYNCDSLTSITIPDGVTGIGNYAFSGCSSLISVVLPDSVMNINNGTFSGCSGLTSITLPDSVTSIGNYAFSGCSSLTSVTIPDSMTSIGYDAFYDCSGLINAYYTGDIAEWCNISFAGNTANPMCYADKIYINGKLLGGELVIPDSVTNIGDYAFYGCSSLTSILIPKSVTGIGNRALEGEIYYRGTTEKWNIVSEYLPNANVICNAVWVNIKDETGTDLCKGYVDSTRFKLDDYKKTGYTTYFYTGLLNMRYEAETITSDITLYRECSINQYTYKFVDFDGTIIKEQTVDYGVEIVAPVNPVRDETAGYTYTFTGWDGYSEGLTQDAQEMVFTAMYNEVAKKCTYRFVDEDGSLILEQTSDYGSEVIAPESPYVKEPRSFDYWDGYEKGMMLQGDIVFTAVYKYNDYTITADGNEFTVTYNSKFKLEPAVKEDYVFVGYFTEQDGHGEKVTNEKGESIKAYDVVGNLEVFAYFEHEIMGRVEVTGDTNAVIGENHIKAYINFATLNAGMYFACDVKIPEALEFVKAEGKDFAEVSIDNRKSEGGYTCISLTCLYDYNGSYIPTNEIVTPIVITLNVRTNSKVGEEVVLVENAVLIGGRDYNFSEYKNMNIIIAPKLAESIEIVHNHDNTCAAIVMPDYTTDKTVTWSISDESIATIDNEGKLTPLKNGTVTVKATANDGSGVHCEKIVNIVAYAKIDTISVDIGVLSEEFNPNVYEYVLYVPENTETLNVTPVYTDGVLRLDDTGIWISGKGKEITLTEDETVFTLNRENVMDMTDSVYTVIVKKVKAVAVLSAEEKIVTLKCVDVEEGINVIFAVYSEGQMISVNKIIYSGEDIQFDLLEVYDEVKIMLWESVSGHPVMEAMIVK